MIGAEWNFAVYRCWHTLRVDGSVVWYSATAGGRYLPLQKLFSRTTELKLLSRSSEVEFHSSADRISVLASQHLDGDNQLMVAEIRSAEE